MKSLNVAIILCTALLCSGICNAAVLEGSTSSTRGGSYAVRGKATGTSGKIYGGKFITKSTKTTTIVKKRAAGMCGIASAGTGNSYGALGWSKSISGTGVCGYTSATTGANYGVHGVSESVSGRGVYGHANNGTGANYGVYGIADGNLGVGVYAVASSITSNLTYGVWAQSNSSDGRGVCGYCTATQGTAYGVLGYSKSGNGGVGVYAQVDSNSTSENPTYGVYAETDTPGGTGVYGAVTATTGTNYGVYGIVGTSGTGYAIYGKNTGTGQAGYFSGDVNVTGNINKAACAFVQPHKYDPNREIQYAAFEGPEHAVFLRGKAQLKNGKAVIETPEHFRIVAAEDEILVQLTPRYKYTDGLAATEVSRDKIVVEELKVGKGNYQFDYFITAKRAGFEKFEPVQKNKHFTAENMTKEEFEEKYSKDSPTTKAMRDMLICNGILTKDGRLNMEVVKKLGWKLKEKEERQKLAAK